MSKKTAPSKVNNKINATTKETDNTKKLFSNDNIYLIFGCGITGKSAVMFCQRHGLPFYITDDNKETLKTLKVNDVDVNEDNKLYDYSEATLKAKQINYIVLSPHIKTQKGQHKIVEIAKNIGAEIISDVDLFYSYLIQYNEMQYEKAKQDNKQYTEKKLIGITGTNGKSTTTALVAHILSKNNKPAIACGNIGVNPLSFTEEEVKKYDYFVVEMSSYNLVISKYVNFDVGGLINVSPDHLDYHGTMEEYIKAKMKIFDLSERKVACIDNEECSRFFCKLTTSAKQKFMAVSMARKDGALCYSNGSYLYGDVKIFDDNFPNLKGSHNNQNIVVAVGITHFCGVDFKQAFEAVKTFQGLEHRLQLIKTIEGIEFVNDSKGTNANSTEQALKAYKDYDVYLIAGGRRKEEGFLALKPYLACVKCVFLIGEATESFAKELDELSIKYVKCGTMDVAVDNAFEMAKNNVNNNKKRVVLLSPLCASFDQYERFEERGDDFCKIVDSIANVKIDIEK